MYNVSAGKNAKRFALGMTLFIAVTGGVLIILDILDIVQQNQIYFPTSAIYASLISAIALSVAYVVTKVFTVSGARQILWFGCGALAFGASNLLGGWAGRGNNTVITVTDSANLIASILFLVGVSLSLSGIRKPAPPVKQKLPVVFSSYSGVLVSLAVIGALAFFSVIPPFHVIGRSTTTVRDVVQDSAAVLSAAAAFLCLKIYSISRDDFSYWYFGGLALFALGVFFGSQSPLDSPLLWLGETSQLISVIYLLIGSLGAVPIVKQKMEMPT